mmetsp:Transcript_7395/g.13346  ORF Transcript_7395/g.13346 Transcript_7395/m.13346 type:complete len:213 (+) Transcript_7395:517-1155(+)
MSFSMVGPKESFSSSTSSALFSLAVLLSSDLSASFCSSKCTVLRTGTTMRSFFSNFLIRPMSVLPRRARCRQPLSFFIVLTQSMRAAALLLTTLSVRPPTETARPSTMASWYTSIFIALMIMVKVVLGLAQFMVSPSFVLRASVRNTLSATRGILSTFKSLWRIFPARSLTLSSFSASCLRMSPRTVMEVATSKYCSGTLGFRHSYFIGELD